MATKPGITKCAVCDKTVYNLEMVTIGTQKLHDRCFQCSHCKKKLLPGNYTSNEGKFYCKPHYQQLFKSKGNYNIGQASSETPAVKPTVSTNKPGVLPSPPVPSSSSSSSSEEEFKEKYPELEVPLQWCIRNLALIQVDRPLYNKHDTVYIRCVLVDHLSYAPCANDPGYVSFEIRNANNEYVASISSDKLDCATVAAQWVVPDIPGGDYTINVRSSDFVTSGSRTFEIREFFAPKLKKQLEFLKKGLGLGDTARAKLEVTTAEGEIPKSATVEATARIDGNEVFRASYPLQEDGTCLIEFKIPEELTEGDGTLNVNIDDGGVTESIGKTIPIFLKKINFKSYPESGNPVLGLTSSVYFSCTTNTGEPADIAGELLASSNLSNSETIDANHPGADFESIATLATIHEGRGRVELTPKEGKAYYVRVLNPSGIRYLIPLKLNVEKSGALITFPHSSVLTPKSRGLNISVQSTHPGTFTLCLYKRHLEVSRTFVEVTEPFKTLNVFCSSPSFAGVGVLRATLFDSQEHHISERLLFQYPKKHIKVEMKTDKPTYSPGEKVTLTISTFDSAQKPVAAYVGVTVTDDSILEMVERRKQQPRIREIALLESEVEEFFDSPVYLRGDEKGHVATDLLLGTQGWRRFVYFKTEQDLLQFLLENQDKVHIERLGRLSNNSSSRPEIFDDFLEMVHVSQLEEESTGINRDRIKREGLPQPVQFQYDGQPRRSGGGPPRFMAPRLSSLSIPKGFGGRGGAPPPPAPGLVFSSSRSSSAPASPSVSSVPRGRVPQKDARKKSRKEKKQLMVSPMAIPTPYSPYYGVRVYAHMNFTKKNKDKTAPRDDFRETIYWNAATLVKGERQFRFQLPDSITSFKAQVDAFNSNDLFGACDCLIKSTAAFVVEPKLPTDVCVGDKILAPIVLMNNTSKKITNVNVLCKTGPWLQDVVYKEQNISLEPNARIRKNAEINVDNSSYILPIRVAAANGRIPKDANSVMFGRVIEKLQRRKRIGAIVKAIETEEPEPEETEEEKKREKHVDKIEKQIKVFSLGFPRYFFHSGKITEQRPQEWTCDIPEIEPDSLKASFTFSSSPGATIMDTMRALIKRPHGCFEQVGSTLFPSVFALKFFQENNVNDKFLLNRANNFIKDGYKLLKKFESKTGGFEWFGGNIGNEYLTAYGLLLFQHLEWVYDGVDQALVKRCIDWLLSRRDGKGRFDQRSGVSSFAVPSRNVAQAYILWALTNRSVEADLKLEIDTAFNTASTSEDNYLVALTALVLLNVGRRDDAATLIPKLDRNCHNGRVSKGKETIVCSDRDGIDTQTTAFALLVWMKFDKEKYSKTIEQGIDFIISRRWGSCWDSSQSNTMCVMAYSHFVGRDKIAQKARLVPKVTLECDGQTFTKDVLVGTTRLEDITSLLTTGSHKIKVSVQDVPLGGELAVSVSFNTNLPNNDPDCKLAFTTGFANNVETLNEGEGTEVNVQVKNITDAALPMVTAEVRLPGGVEPRHQKLKELVKTGKVHYYEIFGSRNIVFYWRGMEASSTIDFSFDVVANIPGSYTGMASVAYLYYAAGQQFFAPGLKLNILPRQFVKAPEKAPAVAEPEPAVAEPEPAVEIPSVVTVPEEPPVLDYYSSGNSINDFYGGVVLTDKYNDAPTDDLSAFYGGVSRPTSFIIS